MLTDTVIQAAKPRERLYKLYDARGLYLLVAPHGSRWWRFRYRLNGREKGMSLGTYPDVSLLQARLDCDAARSQVANGEDPGALRRKRRAPKVATFQEVADEWFDKFEGRWVPAHAQKIKRRLECHVYPWLGAKPAAQISGPEVLDCIRRIESVGSVETGRRVLQTFSRIMRYAIVIERATRNPAEGLRDVLEQRRKGHLAAITDPAQFGKLLRAIDGYHGSSTVRAALRLAPLVFLRTTELRMAEWSEINFDTREWRIPAQRMKMRQPHWIPLSVQALQILKEQHVLTGRHPYVFPSARSWRRPMSTNGALGAMRILGYEKGTLTFHGFRATATTLLNEQGWNRDAIERQLAHSERNSVRAAYNYAQFMPERRRMMQAWADYLDQLRAGILTSTQGDVTLDTSPEQALERRIASMTIMEKERLIRVLLKELGVTSTTLANCEKQLLDQQNGSGGYA